MNSDDATLLTIENILHHSGLALPDSEFGVRCAGFASQIFSSTWSRLGLRPDDRKLAIAATLLHEVGSLTSRRDQHRKSFDVLRAADLPGFTEAERLIVACAARYHGGPYPSIEHAGFGEMSADDQYVVRRLAAIGRVAVALDASYLGAIDRIEISGDERGVFLSAYAPHVPAVEYDSLREVEGSFQALTQVRLVTTIRAATS